MNYLQPKYYNPNIVQPTQLAPMQTTPVTNAGAVSGGSLPYAQLGSMAGQAIQSTGKPDKPNYGANIGGGALSGAATGASIGSFAGPVGTAVGGVVGGVAGAVGGFFKSKKAEDKINYQENQLQEMRTDQIYSTDAKRRLKAVGPGYSYTPTFAKGGMLDSYAKGGIRIEPSKRGTFKAQATKMGMGVQEAASKILNAPEGEYTPTMRKKANFAKNFAKANGGSFMPINNEDITLFNSDGSTHEQSPYGGIPIGGKGVVEDGEVRYGDYIFSNRF